MRTTTLAPAVLALAALAALPAAADNPNAEIERSFVLASFIDGDSNRHAISGDGQRVLFNSTGDPLGTNPDGNTEIFLWDRDEGLTQLSDSTADNFIFDLALDFTGTTGAVIAGGDPLATGEQVRELYRWTEEDGLERVTVTTDGTILGSPTSITDDGSRILFNSNADYTGENPDGNAEAFFWEEGLGIRQITHGAPCANPGGSAGHDVSGDGTRVLLSSRCQFGKLNADLGNDLFLWDEEDGIRPLTARRIPVFAEGRLNTDGTVAALTSGFDLANNGATGRHLYRWTEKTGFVQLSTVEVGSGRPDIDGAGRRIVYTARNGQGSSLNPERSPEVFLWRGEPIYDEDNRIAAITDSTDSNSTGMFSPRISALGRHIAVGAFVAFDPPKDPRKGTFLLDVVTAEPPRRNLLANGDFGSGLGGWELEDTVEFSTADATFDPASGSALQPNTENDAETTVVALRQCVQVRPSERYVLSGMLRGTSSGESGRVLVGAFWHATEDCSSTEPGLGLALNHQRSDGDWVGHVLRLGTANDTRALEIALAVDKEEAGGFFEGGLDNISLRLDPEPQGGE